MKYRHTLLFLIIDLFLIGYLNAQSQRDYLKYLKNNSFDLKDSGANWDSFLDSSFYKNNLFWIGETHAIKYSYDANWILFKQIHSKTGFKYYLLEAGYISEIYLNKYLETGDENYLQMEFNSIKGTMGCNIDAFDFYRKLYTYNQGLPREKRIEIVSIDIEHQYKETDKYIRSLWQNYEMTKDTNEFINRFCQFKEDYKNLYNKLFIDISKDSAKYKAILKFDYPTFWYLVRNITYLFQAKASSNWNKTRDSLMFENYKIRLLNHDFIKSKAFAYFGTGHCYLERTKNTQWIASLIKDSYPSVKSTSIIFLYSDCKAMRPIWSLPKNKQKSAKANKGYVNVSFSNDFENSHRKFSKSDYTLFNITNTSITFNTSKIFRYDTDNEKSMRDYFHYILLIKDSPASMPYEK